MTPPAWPTPLPVWFWTWALWRDHGGIPDERPASIPARIPAWAWDRYKLHQGTQPKPVRSLGVYERVAFFVNPGAGSPVGGAGEILEGAFHAGVTLACVNRGDNGNWQDWLGHTPAPPFSQWARCDTEDRCTTIRWTGNPHDIANIESPEMASGFCTPARALSLVGIEGAIITESAVPHADWSLAADDGTVIFIEIDPNVPLVRDTGIAGLVEYGEKITGCVVIPAFFATVSPWWDGSEKTWETYWDQLREQWPAPKPFAIYSAENVASWEVVR